MQHRASFFALLFFIGFLAIPHFAFAGANGGVPFFGPLVPPEGQACAAGFGLLMQVVNNIISLLLTLAIVFVAPLSLAWAGFLMVVNVGDSGRISQAKGIITNTVVGIVIALAGWLIVDAIMAVLYNPSAATGQTKLGAWTSLVTGSGNACLLQEGVIKDLNQGAGPGQKPPGVATTSPNGTTFTYDPGIAAQVSAESGTLASLLSCMAAKLPAGVGRISSISDSLITSGQKTFAQCAAGGCQHGANSCHYGGRACIGSSYAVDFGDGDPDHPQNLAALQAAAQACNANFMTDNEDGKRTHLHVSVGASCGCN